MAVWVSEMNTDHKQISITYPFTGEIIEVDEGIVEILELIWSVGVETFYSCEGDENNYAYIAYSPRGDREIRKVIHSMALPYVWWTRRDEFARYRPEGPIWCVYWVWDWSIYIRVQALLREGG